MGPLSKYLIDTYNWKNTLVIQAVMISLCSLFALAYRPIQPTIVSDMKEEEEANEKKSLTGEMTPAPGFKPFIEERYAYSMPNSAVNIFNLLNFISQHFLFF